MERGQGPESELKTVPSEFTPEEIASWGTVTDTPQGKLHHMTPVISLSETPPRWDRPAVPLGHHKPVWPERSK